MAALRTRKRKGNCGLRYPISCEIGCPAENDAGNMAARGGMMESARNHTGPGLLDLSGQRLQKLDASLIRGTRTITLILDQNHIIKLENLEQLQHTLQQLSAASNRLVRMMGVSKLTGLRILNLPNNSIGHIEGLKDLLQLQWLNLAGNNIKVMEQLHSCVSLQHLDLSDNNISHIGDVSKLSALKTLLLHGNIITSLRAAPALLPPDLCVLSLAENEIRDLAEVSYLAPLHSLEHLSLRSNPCVLPTPALPACDPRPYVVSWCLRLKVLDGYVVSQKEGLKGEWLYSQGKGRAFRPGQHAQLVQYLASVCPLTNTALQSEEDAKLDKILNKQRQHQEQLQQARVCWSQSPVRPTQLDVQRDHGSREDEEEDEEEEEEDVIPHTASLSPAADPGVQVNAWMEGMSPPAGAAVRLPPAAEDELTVEDVLTDEEKLDGSLLSSESAFLPFNPAVRPASAPDSGEEEFDDSLAPPTSSQPRPSEAESVGGADLTSLTQGSARSDQRWHTDGHVVNTDAVFLNGAVEDWEWTGIGTGTGKAAVTGMRTETETGSGDAVMTGMGTGSGTETGMGTVSGDAVMTGMGTGSGTETGMGTGSGTETGMGTGSGMETGMGTGSGSAAVGRCVPQEAAVRIQAWWRGHCTRHSHPQAREVRAEIRLRRMQDHIVHLTAELDRVRQQQEDERLQRRVQEEAVKFLWKQLQALLEWQSSVRDWISASNPSIPAPIRSEISIPESGFHSRGERQAAPDTSRSSSATAGSPETVRSLGTETPAAGDSLIEQYLSSVQRLEEEGDRTGSCDPSPHGKS